SGILQPLELPGLAGVRREIHAAPEQHVVARIGFTGADPDVLRVRRRQHDRADGRGIAVLENVVPLDAVVGGLPHATARGADVIDTGLARNPGHRADATARYRGPQVAELQVRE